MTQAVIYKWVEFTGTLDSKTLYILLEPAEFAFYTNKEPNDSGYVGSKDKIV